MKIKNLTAEYISSLNEDDLRDIKCKLLPALSSTRKSLKKWQNKPLTNNSEAKEYAAVRNALGHQEAMREAVLCREDELFGPGVLSTSDHTESFT